MRCRYCGYHNGEHASQCPPQESPEMEIWKSGYADGRAERAQPKEGAEDNPALPYSQYLAEVTDTN